MGSMEIRELWLELKKELGETPTLQDFLELKEFFVGLSVREILRILVSAFHVWREIGEPEDVGEDVLKEAIDKVFERAKVDWSYEKLKRRLEEVF